MHPKNIRTTAEVWGAGPGMGGTSYIEFKLNGQIYEVFAGGTAFEDREKLGEVRLSDGWRGRISFIVNEFPAAHEEKSPDDIVVRGAKSPEMHLLAAAWSGETGAQFVSFLLELEDAEVEKLIELAQDDLAAAADTVAYARFKMRSDDADVLRDIRGMLEINCLEWDLFRSRLDATAAAEKAKMNLEMETERDIRASAISPHAGEIEKIIQLWVADEERNARAAGPGLVAFLKDALENHVVREGQMPSGIFEFAFWYKTSTFGRRLKRVIEVDLDLIRHN